MKWLWGLVCFSSLAFAHPVQLESLKAGATSLKHTGIGIRDGGRTFVLSAASAAQGDTFRVSEPGYSAAARLLVADWGRGLALFEVSGGPSTWVFLTDLSPLVPASGSPITVEGFGLTDTTAKATAPFRVLASSSTRHSIALVGNLLEANGAAVGVGYVGSPVYDAQHRLVGLLTHQYLKLKPGTSTRPYDWDQMPGHTESHVLVYPMALVSAWLKDALKGTIHVPFVDYKPADATAGPRISFAGVTVRELAPKFLPSGQVDGDFPVGGGDGVGVGGDAQLELASKAFVTAAPAIQTVFPFANLLKWHQGLVALSAAVPLIEIPFLLREDPVTQTREYKSFRSLSELFLLMGRQQGDPLVIRQNSVPTDLFRAAATTAEFVSRYKDWALIYSQPDIVFLLRQIYLQAKLLQSESIGRVTLAALDELGDLQGPHRWAWNVLTQAPSQGAPLIKYFRAMRDEFAKGSHP